MKYVTITNLNQPSLLPVLARCCQSFFCQLRGLMFTDSLPAGQGLLLIQKHDSRLGSSIHMMFMNYDIAVVWFNSDLEVVDACLAKRWQPYYAPRRPACYVLELPATRLDDFHIGDKVSLEEAWLD